MVEFLALLLAVLRAGLRSRADLVAENLLLRHQLAVLTRPTRKRAKVQPRDKLLWVLARRVCREWRRHLVLVRPETVVGWHRRGCRLFWRWRSRCPLGRPRLSPEVRDLIATISRDKPPRDLRRRPPGQSDSTIRGLRACPQICRLARVGASGATGAGRA